MAVPLPGTGPLTGRHSTGRPMALVDTLSLAVHMVVAATFVGGIIFFAGGVLPRAKDGTLNAKPLAAVTRSLRRYSRVGALLLFVTGSHLAGSLYTVERLTGSGDGHLVLSMIALWLVTTGLVEVGAGKLVDGADQMKVRSPAREANWFLKGAAVAGSLAFVVAALLIAV